MRKLSGRVFGGIAFGILLGLGCGPRQSAGDDAAMQNHNDAAVTPDAFVSDPFTDDDGDGYSEVQGDCDDASPLVHPFAVEICGDGVDNDCNGFVDGYEPDKDGDGFGPCQGDCDDNNPEVNPIAIEVLDGTDNNCDGIVDADFDGDGFTVTDGDCDDHNPEIYPGAVEHCYDGVDNNCNGYTDTDEPDQDGDGYGPCQGDCDDTDPNVRPNRPELPGDGIDNNCDNLVDEDIDGDGWTVANGDCDDNNPARHPAEFEICGDGIDNDCDGVVDTDCLSECEVATLTRSNVGCEYFAVDMDNYPGLADVACYAIIVSNTHATKTANVQILQHTGGAPQPLDFPGFGTSRTIPPGGLQVFRVSGACSAPGAAVAGNLGVTNTALGARGALMIVSDLPVVAYQINPFEAATIHTTDASLLIPKAALDRHYYVVSYPQTNPSRGAWDLPANYNIVATEDNTLVTITSSTSIRAGTGIPALSQGQVWSTTLNAYDNLQMATATTGNDVSGTYITASAPIAVWGGNQCADVPINVGYCDHLEEQMTPLTTWGTQYACARHPPRGSEPVLWRFVAAVAGTTITFDPAVSPPVTLNAGQVHEISVTQDFLATSDSPNRPFMAVQVMVGAALAGESLGNLRGNPAMTLSVPTAQYLDRYAFLSDPTYSYNWLVVVRTNSSDVIRLDCLDPIPNARFATIGSGPYQVARITLSAESGGVDGTCTSGAHFISGDGPFGIWVFGVYADTSYGYPGGMNLAQIYTVY